MAENLRDLVPPEQAAAAARGPRFKSTFNPKAVPTYSTFVKSPPSEVPKSEWLRWGWAGRWGGGGTQRSRDGLPQHPAGTRSLGCSLGRSLACPLAMH
jgi:hypothetical protein